MAVTVEIPAFLGGGATTISGPNTSWVSSEPDFSKSETTAVAKATQVDSIIDTMLSLSSSSSAEAEALIENLFNYPKPTLPSIDYTPPTWASPSYVSSSYTQILPITVPDADSSVSRSNTSFNNVPAPSTSISEPTLSVPGSVSVPSFVTSGLAAPSAPSEYTVSTPAAPTLNIGSASIDSVESPILDEIAVELPSAISLDALSVAIDTSDLDRAVSLLESVSAGDTQLPEYNEKFDSVFGIVGSMLNADFGLTDYINFAVSDARLSKAFTRRGVVIPPAVGTYEAWHAAEINGVVAKRTSVQDAREKDTVTLAAYQLAADAEILAYDIAAKTQAAKFKFAMAEAEVQALQAKAIVSAYNAKVAELTAQVIEYNAVAEQLKAEAQASLAQLDNVKLIADANKLIAREFGAIEASKKTEASIYASRVGAEAAKLDAYRAELESYSAHVASAQLKAATYSAKVQEYAVQVETAKNEYDIYSAKADATVQNNRRIISEINADSTKTAAYATQARSLATNASVESIKRTRQYIDESAAYTTATNTNAKVGADLSKQLAQYSVALSNYSGGITYDAILPEAYARENQAIASFIESSMSAANRAAEASQRANESLSRAYASAYDAAGRAGASLAAGKMSGFRASVALSASGSYSGSDSYSITDSATGNKNYTESETSNLDVSA